VFSFNFLTKTDVTPFSTKLPPTKIKLAFKVSIFFEITGIYSKVVLSLSSKMDNNFSPFFDAFCM
jgi:hypothetical protein